MKTPGLDPEVSLVAIGDVPFVITLKAKMPSHMAAMPSQIRRQGRINSCHNFMSTNEGVMAGWPWRLL